LRPLVRPQVISQDGPLNENGAGKSMRTGLNTALDPTRRSNDAQEFENFLRR